MKQKGNSLKICVKQRLFNGLFVINLFFVALNLNAQNTVEKRIYTEAENISITFDFIDNLELLNSDNQFVEVIAENNFEAVCNFSLEEISGKVLIEANDKKVDDLSDNSKICTEQPKYSSYKVIVPKNRNIDIFIKEGNVVTKDFYGNINLKLEKGSIDIDNFYGMINVIIDIGNVYCKLQDSKIDVESNLGEIKSDLSFENIIKSNKSLYLNNNTEKNEFKVRGLNANVYIKESKI